MPFRIYDMGKASHAHLNALEALSTKIFFKEFEKSKFHIRSVSFMEPIVALNQIIQQKKFEFCENKGF